MINRGLSVLKNACLERDDPGDRTGLNDQREAGGLLSRVFQSDPWRSENVCAAGRADQVKRDWVSGQDGAREGVGGGTPSLV